MLTWLDYFCRRAVHDADAKWHADNPGRKAADAKWHADDPRKAVAFYITQLLHQAKKSPPFEDILDEVFFLMLAPFFQGFLPDGVRWTMAGTEPPRPLGLLLTRDTANLLSAADCSNISDEAWRSELDPRRVIYIDVPHGAIRLDVGTERSDMLQLRALFAAPFMPPDMPGHTVFVAQMTTQGSERGRGRIAGVLQPDGRISRFGGAQTPGRTATDRTLRPPFVHPQTEKAVLARAGTFLRLVLAYHFFGPQEAHEQILATPSEKLRNGKPRKEESLFALTRLHASSKVGRPESTIPSSWSLTSRHEVTGHFKLQPYGPRQSLRRLIWVAGYERGPADTPIKPRAFVI